MKDNRGLSLVELLLTVTILALVITGAATFMMTGSRSFAKGSADSNVQSEAELAVNQIEDLVIDVNGGVDYVTAGNTESLVMYHVEADSSGVSVYKKRNVTWNKTDNNIYSSEWTVDKDPSSGVYAETSTIYADQLLAENVTDFNVDLSDIVTETDKDGNDIDIVRSVVIKVGCLDGTGKAAYATTPTITLRNRMILSSSPETIFPNTPTPDDSLLLYISDTGMEAAVPIRGYANANPVERGKIYNIFAMVNTGTNVNSLCNFTVEGETSGTNSTITPSGVHIALSVNAAEPNNYLKITASYATNPSKTVSGWVKVIGGDSKSLESVKIIPQNYPNGQKPNGFTERYTSSVKYHGFSQAEVNELKYTWSVSEPSKVKSFTNNNKDLTLEIIQEDGNYDIVFKIELVVYSPTTNQSVSDWIWYRTAPEGTTGGDSLLERGKLDPNAIGYHGDNWYTFKKPYDVYPVDVIYDYYFCDIYGERISKYDNLLGCVVMKPGLENYYLSFTDDLPPQNEYYIKIMLNFEQFKYIDENNNYHEVKASDYEAHNNQYHHDYTGTNWKYSRIHYIPAVTLLGGELHRPSTKLTAYFDFTYDLIGYYELTWSGSNPPVYEYEVVEVITDPVLPDGYSVETDIGNTQTRGETTIWAQATAKLVVPEGKEWIDVNLKSMKIRVKMKTEDPKTNISTDVNVVFDL